MKILFSRRMLALLCMGFSSGLPLSLTGTTLQAWMKHAGIDLTWIGMFALAGIPYTIKFLWAPILDRFSPAYLDRRRSWALLTQIGISVLLFFVSFLEPTQHLLWIAGFTVAIAFLSATQDIALDAYRRELLPREELGLGSSIFIYGYRFGILLSTAGALILADHASWNTVYRCLAGSLVIGLCTSLWAPTLGKRLDSPQTLREAVVGPFLDFFSRQNAWLYLAFMLLYKIGDSMAATMTTPFILSLGFSQSELGLLGNTWGMAAAIVGGLWGGFYILRRGIIKALWLFGILQMISTLGFCVQNYMGENHTLLAFVIGFESLTSGMGTSAFVAFMANLCAERFTATQYALLSSFTGLPRVFAGAPTGYLAKTFGFGPFFFLCTLLALPGLYLLARSIHDETKR